MNQAYVAAKSLMMMIGYAVLDLALHLLLCCFTVNELFHFLFLPNHVLYRWLNCMTHNSQPSTRCDYVLQRMLTMAGQMNVMQQLQLIAYD